MGLSYLGDLHDRTRAFKACQAPAAGAAPCGRGERQCCRHLPLYGISRQCRYIWLRRYEAEGLTGWRTARPR
ncbi:leucine zipper domain-containing protein [Streptomyces sp. NPDC049597]|uniref:leucine zipper domain-containing protein n=1 Tax=Streptomyces sp. NPDC049597 TaxID=3155276 RepID=UPI003441D70F